MVKKLLTVLALIFTECKRNEVSAITTSELNNRLTNIEKHWNEKMSKLNGELQTLETKIAFLTNRTEEELNTDQKINNMNHKLQKLENEISNIKKEANKVNCRVQALESQNTQILQKSTPLKKSPLIAPPKNCYELKRRGSKTSNTYFIKPSDESKIIPVLCDMKTMGGGWTYILNRFNGSQNFAQNWTDYKNGFGDNRGEFWLGLDNIHYLTGSWLNELLVNLTDWDDKQVYAHYRQFSVDNEDNDYILNFASVYSGTAGDSLNHHQGKLFSTPDKKENCASHWGGSGWWCDNRMDSLLTGKYWKENVTEVSNGMMWAGFHGNRYSLKAASMMVRPINVH